MEKHPIEIDPNYIRLHFWRLLSTKVKKKLIDYVESLHGKPVKRERFMELFDWSCDEQVSTCDLPDGWIKKIENKYGQDMKLNFIGENKILKPEENAL
jgi:hypothetical protein